MHQAQTTHPMPIDPVTGLVHCVEIKTGQVRKLAPVDAREQLFHPTPSIRLAGTAEAPHVDPARPMVQWDAYTVVQLREYVQDAGIAVVGGISTKSKAQLVDILEQSGYLPHAEGPPVLTDETGAED